MALSSFSVFKKNFTNLPSGLLAFFQNVPFAFNTWKLMYNRSLEFGHEGIKEQIEIFDERCWRRRFCQRENMWVDVGLSQVITQPELAKYHHIKLDSLRLAHGAVFPMTLCGFGIPFQMLWLSRNSFAPKSFNLTADELHQWRLDQDLYRYRFMPHFLALWRLRWASEISMTDAGGEKFDELWEKSNVRRNPDNMRDVADMIDKVYPFYAQRRREVMSMGRAMGFPQFPTLQVTMMMARVRDYWNLIFNEDYMVITGNLVKSMSDEELYDYAWRRFLAPYDQNLPREIVEQRVDDYHTFLGQRFVESQYTPNIKVLFAYCGGYYNEPSFLTEDIAELDKNDFEYMQDLGKDMFLKRLEFENGPLRDQVEVHSISVMKKHEKQISENLAQLS